MSTISFPDWINSLSPQSTDGKNVYQQDGSTPSRGDLDDKASLSAINNDPNFYEEGTWTPSDGSGAGLSFNTGREVYAKIGSLVYVSARITFPTTSDTSLINITGLPFEANTIRVGVGNETRALHSSLRIGNTRADIQARKSDNSGFATNADVSGETIHVNITYTV